MQITDFRALKIPVSLVRFRLEALKKGFRVFLENLFLYFSYFCYRLIYRTCSGGLFPYPDECRGGRLLTFASKRALVAARPSVVYAGGALGSISGYRPVRVFGKLPADFPNDFLRPFYLDNRVFVSYTYYRSFTWRDVRVWLKEHDWKSCIRETVSRVRIPLSPYASPCI